MSVSAPCPPDSPLMIAWNAYKATGEYPNTKKWAVYPEHVEGSLWAAFMAGFNAQSACISDVTRESEKFERALLKVRTALGLDLDGHDDLLDVIGARAAHALKLREFVEMVASYEGKDPLTTDYRAIVRDFAEWARGALEAPK